MRDAGRLHGPEIACGGEPISAGDTVVLRLNDRRRGVTNGDRGIVRAVGIDGLTLQLGARVVELDGEYLSRVTGHGDLVVAPGYAVTGHVAQGLTTHRAFAKPTGCISSAMPFASVTRSRRGPARRLKRNCSALCGRRAGR
jgi:hypothetical protein